MTRPSEATLNERLGPLREAVEAELRLALADDGSAPGLHDMLRYHLGWLDQDLRATRAPSGKLLRPVLCLLAARAVGGDYRLALPAAASVELLHNFSLIHDDIQDRGEKRRHRPTVWSIWGDAQGIDAGDAMLAISELTMISSVERGVSADLVLAAARLLNRACLRLAQGQHLDIGFEGKLDVSAESYLAMVSGKTAALLGCSLEVGALIGSGDRSLAAGYGSFGEYLGTAFQMQDDLLGIWGDEARMGKGASDIGQRKMTLPIIHALANASPADRSNLVDVYRSKDVSEEQVARAVRILDSTGSRAFVADKALCFYRQAMAKLVELGPLDPAGEMLRAIAAFTLDRDY